MWAWAGRGRGVVRGSASRCEVWPRPARVLRMTVSSTPRGRPTRCCRSAQLVGEGCQVRADWPAWYAIPSRRRHWRHTPIPVSQLHVYATHHQRGSHPALWAAGCPMRTPPTRSRRVCTNGSSPMPKHTEQALSPAKPAQMMCSHPLAHADRSVSERRSASHSWRGTHSCQPHLSTGRWRESKRKPTVQAGECWLFYFVYLFSLR